ncbi:MULTISPECIES: hotdog fold thioesterase [unclassified Lentimicrobium]|uniref:hotdog fold thioesterase n=1 Tax=unclassified Lentimicrobium TaxID=2677434 RepID=UPI001556FFFB|nr:MULTISPECIES: hotdog fold thioesterase [unclassified Lentimicrobium]NPD46783.1 hotdog fold thioesterase [Lentimicrobium sp. S6]NPD85686.1 hotdog fold thioesterase [Lentimicrobium sp. L6]
MSLIDQVNSMSKGTLMEALNIEMITVEKDLIRAKMPVDERTFQPFKILHGGASLALAETIGSVGSHIIIGPNSNKTSRGAGINASHLRAVRSGYVIGEARPIHLGKNTHIWDIKIFDEQERLVSIARLTNFILESKEK